MIFLLNSGGQFFCLLGQTIRIYHAPIIHHLYSGVKTNLFHHFEDKWLDIRILIHQINIAFRPSVFGRKLHCYSNVQSNFCVKLPYVICRFATLLGSVFASSLNTGVMSVFHKIFLSFRNKISHQEKKSLTFASRILKTLFSSWRISSLALAGFFKHYRYFSGQ